MKLVHSHSNQSKSPTFPPTVQLPSITYYISVLPTPELLKMRTQKLKGPGFVTDATPLTREAFAPFGDVVENPRPNVRPSAANKSPSLLPSNAISANQGSAIKYEHVSHQINLYDQAPSGRPGSATMNMFVCAARARIPDPPSPQRSPPSTFPVTVLERHPYTTQTFIPLTADPKAHYLIIVAPSLPPAANDDRTASGFPVPTITPTNWQPHYQLPGAGMPDLHRLRAFVVNATQAVTYGAGTWHAPMVALGDEGTALDFVVVQFANGVGEEDCQEVVFESRKGHGGGGIVVRLRPAVVGGMAKL
jgi:ureidoglycolate lyase